MTGRLIRRLGRDRRGSFSVELALAIPLVMFMMVKTFSSSSGSISHSSASELLAVDMV